MKKTLVALAVAALATNSANAFDIINSEETGTRINFQGSLRLQWRSTADKVSPVDGETTRNHVNQAVRNNGSRFGFHVRQNIAGGVYALGRVEWRLRGTSSSQHDFDDIYTRQLYAGFGHKDFGEITYGHQTTITDEVKQTDLPNTLSLSDGLLNYAARKSVQYVYKGIDGLKVGGYYGGSSKRNDSGLDLAQDRRDVWGLAAIYRHKFDDLNSIVMGTGVTHERFKANGNLTAYDTTANSFGVAYTYDKTTFGVDLERREAQDQYAIGNERVQKEVRTVVFHRVTPDLNAYGMYAYKTNEWDYATGRNTEAKTHQFMIGSEYFLARDFLKQYNLRAKTFVEWQTGRTKNETNGVKTSKTRNNQTVIGFRVYW